MRDTLRDSFSRSRWDLTAHIIRSFLFQNEIEQVFKHLPIFNVFMNNHFNSFVTRYVGIQVNLLLFFVLLPLI